MLVSLRGYWNESAGYQRFVYDVGVLFLLSGICHTAVFWMDGGSWSGPVSWRKPISFSFSFALISFSLAWVLSFLPRRAVWGWIVMGVYGGASVVETALIAMQTWRGVASHFNSETGFDELVFASMGVMIALVFGSIVAITVWTFRFLEASSSFAWAIKSGLLLLIAGQLLGGLLIREGFRQVEAGAASSPLIFGSAGVMNVPHAVSLHALQVLPLLAWLAMFTLWDETRRTRLVVAATAGYTGLVFVGIVQALGGEPPLSFTLMMALVFWISAALLLGPFAVIAAELMRERTGGREAPGLRGAHG